MAMDTWSEKYNSVLVSLLLILITIGVYCQVYNFEFVSLDDYSYVSRNDKVLSGFSKEGILWCFKTTHMGNWHPLTWLSFMMDCHFFKNKQRACHITNIMFHVANTVLLFWLMKRMTCKSWGSAFVAAAFALHPLHVESVAWISERKDVLSTFFWFLTMYFYVRYTERPRTSRYIPAIVFFALGLMCKSMLVTLPFVLLLIDYWPLKRLELNKLNSNKKDRKNREIYVNVFRRATCLVVEKIPFFVLTVILCFVTYLAQQSAGAVGEKRLILRLGNAVLSYGKYIWKMAWPKNLAMFYPYFMKEDIGLPLLLAIVGTGFFLIIITVVSVFLWRRKPFLIVGWLWYLGTLVPVIGIIVVGSQAMADRYTYIPLIGLFIIFAWGVPDILKKLRYRKTILPLAGVLLLTVWSVWTWFQVGFWRNGITLYEHAIAITRNNFIAYSSLAFELHKQGKSDEAIKYFMKALQIDPKYSLAKKNLGFVYLSQDKYKEAIELLNQVILARPDWYDAYYALGQVYAKVENFDKAIENYQKSLRLKPDSIDLQNKIGEVYYKQGRIEKAIEYWDKSLSKNYEQPEVLNNLAWLLATKADKSIQDTSRAVELAQKACSITIYKKAEILDTLAVTYASAGRFQEAIKIAQKALHLAQSKDNSQLVSEVSKKLELYQKGQPYSE